MKYFIICFAISLVSCSGSSQEQNKPASNNKKSPNNKSCLAEITDPAEWVSLSAIAAIANTPEESIEKKANERFKSLSFKWKSGRTYTMKVGNIEQEIPNRNVIGISIKNLDEAIEKAERMHRGKRTFTYEEYFNGYHSQITEEDQKIIDEQIDKKGEEDKDFDAKLAKKILAAVPTQDYAEVENVGDKANKYVQLGPGLRETRLAVLQGNVVILVSVDISDEDVDDLTAAKKVAEAVVALCD